MTADAKLLADELQAALDIAPGPTFVTINRLKVVAIMQVLRGYVPRETPVTVEMMEAGVHAFTDYDLRLQQGMSLERALVKVYEAMRAASRSDISR